jgi:hypothetical protein
VSGKFAEGIKGRILALFGRLLRRQRRNEKPQKSADRGLPFPIVDVLFLFRLTKHRIVEPLNRPINWVFGFNGSVVEWQNAF